MTHDDKRNIEEVNAAFRENHKIYAIERRVVERSNNIEILDSNH